MTLNIEKFRKIEIIYAIFDYVFSEFCSKNTVIFSHKRFLLCYSFISCYDYPSPKVNPSIQELLIPFEQTAMVDLEVNWSNLSNNKNLFQWLSLYLETLTGTKSAAEKNPYQQIFMTLSKTYLKNRNSENCDIKKQQLSDGPEDCYLKILLRFCCNIFLNFSLWNKIDAEF